jgi:hypothetical protein
MGDHEDTLGTEAVCFGDEVEQLLSVAVVTRRGLDPDEFKVGTKLHDAQVVVTLAPFVGESLLGYTDRVKGLLLGGALVRFRGY